MTTHPSIKHSNVTPGGTRIGAIAFIGIVLTIGLSWVFGYAVVEYFLTR